MYLHPAVYWALLLDGRQGRGAGKRGRGIFRVGAKLRPCEKCRTAGRRVKSPSHLRSSLTTHALLLGHGMHEGG